MASNLKKILGYENQKLTKNKTGLDLLKERFGHSSVDRELNSQESVYETLNNKFNPKKNNENIKSFKEQYEDRIEKKQKIIKNLELETTELAKEVLHLKKERSTILEELKAAKWMENKVALTTKKMYEEKIKTIINEFKSKHIDNSKIISLLTAVSRKKQGNQKLNYGDWLRIPENKYLEQINQNIAKNIFENTNALIDRNVNYMNQKRRNYGGDAPNYNIKFGGQVGNRAFVQTGFNPDNLRLGFTVSYWVRPDAVSTPESNTVPMFALGRKHNNNQRFSFGINTSKAIFVGVGGERIRTTYASMGVNTNSNLSHLLNDDNSLKTGKWINFVITYANRTVTGSDAELKIYMNGELIKTNNLDWSQGGGGTSGLMLGARNLSGDFNRGWDCGLDEVAIYDTDKGTSFAQEVYDGGTDYDHTGASNLVAYWKMNEGSGTTVIDHSSNGNDGSLETDGTGYPIWEKIENYK